MRRAVLAGVLGLCGCGSDWTTVAHHDGGGEVPPPSHGSPCPSCGTSGRHGSCGRACGKQPDRYLLNPESDRVPLRDLAKPEPCDGSAGLHDCTSFGYYGSSDLRGLYTRGHRQLHRMRERRYRVRDVRYDFAVGVQRHVRERQLRRADHAGDVEIFDGAIEVARAMTTESTNAVAIPGGWLLASGSQQRSPSSIRPARSA